jgi:hypothetical protein
MKKISLFLLSLSLVVACSTPQADLSEPVTQAPEETETDLVTYEDNDYGVSFSYPSLWTTYSFDVEGGPLDFRVSNQTPQDGYGCSEPYLGFYLVSRDRDVSEGSFRDWVTSQFGNLQAWVALVAT